jgi:uncharacterized protein with FMN-binding domain
MQRRIKNLKRGVALWLAAILAFSCFAFPALAADGHTYRDGRYTGSGAGYGGPVPVEVTVESGLISGIVVGSNNETPGRLESAKAVINRIIAAQSTDVDTVSGATVSSGAIISAVNVALAQAYDGIFDSGSGTAQAPFVIADAGQLEAFRDSANSGETYEGKYFVLSGDISISGDEWTPILNFAGSFDGAGHVISGLTIGSPEAPAACANAGLFSSLAATAVVKNLGLTDVAIYVSNADLTYAGGLAAKTANGTAAGGTIIDNCYVNGTMIDSQTTASRISYAGGLVAFLGAYGSLTNCRTDIPVTAKVGGTVSSYAGGLTAVTGNNIAVINCYTLGGVTSTCSNVNNGAAAGGLFGMQGGRSYNCYSLSEVTVNNVNASSAYQSTTYSLIGALAGQVTSTAMMDTVYYSTDAAITLNGVACSPVAAVGRGASNSEPVNVTGLSADEMASESLVAALNNGLASVEQNITVPNGVSMYAWELSGGVVTLSDEIYGGDEIDDGIFAGGDGTAENPYILQTEEQLRSFAASLDKDIDYGGLYIRLANDIDVSGADWNPAGQGEYAFCGTFDGGGHKIRGLKYGSPTAAKDATDAVYVALFGVIGRNGLVKNLGLTDIGLYTTGQYSVNTAAIAGYLEGGGIDNCYATGTIVGKTTVRGNNFVGGLVGNQYTGYIINSWTDVDVRSEAVGQYLSETGGLVSLNNRGLIANCYTLGNASGDAVRAAEGMAYVSNLAACQAGTMVNCYVLGDTISDSYSYYVGAISGMTTGIGKGYLSYYNKEAVQRIDGRVPDPFVAVGTTVSMVEDGVVYGGFNYRLAGYTLAEMKSADFAAVLNGNFEAFPVRLSDWLPAGTALKTWTYDGTDGLVLHTSTGAAINYVPVTVEEETDTAYKPGAYYGRAGGDNKIIVKVEVTQDTITGIDVVSHNEGSGFDAAAIIERVLEAQSTEIEYDTADTSIATLLEAIDTALEKAAIGDATGYGKAAPGIFAGGGGKKEDPYRIATAQQLAAFAASINTDEDYKNTYVALTADISLEGISWLPSGSNRAYPFSGTFDGRGHTISHMTIGNEANPADYQYVGLFGYANNAAIRNVKLTGVYINNQYTGNDRAYVGVIAGAVENSTYIDNCSTQGNLTGHAGKQSYVGGLVSYTSGLDGAESYVTNCYTDVDVTGISDTSWVYAGGISGLINRSYAVNCYTLGDVTGNSGLNVNKAATGGIAGFQAGYVRNCYAMGSMKTMPSSTDVGGYAGRHTGIATTYCAYYNTDAAHYSGNTLLEPTPGTGVYVPASGTGLVSAEKVEGRSAEDMKSAEFAALLNGNLSDEKVAGVLPDGITLKSWVRDQTLNLVVLARDSGNSGDSGGTSPGGSTPGGSAPGGTAPVTPPPAGDTSGGKANNSISNVTDIEKHWAKDAIEWVYASGLFSGTSGTTFSPDIPMTRAMLVTVLYRLAGSPGGGKNYFTDIQDGKWYTGPAAWASENGITMGVGGGRFAPDAKISREQLAVMLYRYARVKGLSTAAIGDLSVFPDDDRVSAWAKEAMIWAVGAGIISGRDNGVLDPGGEATRAEAAVILRFFVTSQAADTE